MSHVEIAEELGAGALEWMLHHARETGPGLTWPFAPGGDDTEPWLYNGVSGVIMVLLEGHRHFGDDRYADAALRGARQLASTVDDRPENCSLYTGTTGVAVALRAVHDALGDEASGTAADRALTLVRERFDGHGWGAWTDVISGNAGIALGALNAGDAELAVLAVEPMLSSAKATPNGLVWDRRPDAPNVMHHVSHGTLGFAYALIATGHAVGRDDLLTAGLRGVADVVARNEAGPDGFLVPHSDPQAYPDRTARYNFGWCHGPAGDVHVFRILAQTTGDPQWTSPADGCWRSLLDSGVPERKYPGFWDNHGRCCGTAGVLAVACDRIAERGDGHDFAAVLVGDLAARAVTDETGTRWSNREHREDPPDLEPMLGWAHGSAGIARELLRYARVAGGRDQAYAVAWPDHPAAVPTSA